MNMPKKQRPIKETTQKDEKKATTPWSWISRALTTSCCIFTVASLCVLLVNWIIEGNIDKIVLKIDTFLLLYPTALGIGLARAIRQTPSLKTGLKLVLHPALCLGGILLAYIPYANHNNFVPTQILVHLLVFALAYGIAVAVVCIVSTVGGQRKGKKRKARDEGRATPAVSTYEPVFSKKGNEPIDGDKR